jgi:hypothetical protein
MGVTKQAVQKRFVPKEAPQDFRRFTPRARNAVVAAQNEARTRGNAEIRPEHLILGLLARAGRASPCGHSWRRASLRRRSGSGDGGAAPAVDDVPALIPFDARGEEGARAHLPRGAAAGARLRRHRARLLALLEREGDGVRPGSASAKQAVESAVTAYLG